MLRKNISFFSFLRWLCRQSPSPPAKMSETWSELHKTTLKHMFLASRRGFFPDGLKVCSEVGSPVDLDGERLVGLEWVSFTRHGLKQRKKELLCREWKRCRLCVCVCVSNFYWKLSLRGAWTWGACPPHLSSSHTGFISCHFLLATLSVAGASQVCEWEPEFSVFFLCLFPA